MKLTRYISVPKFLDLLENGLFVPKANCFQDSHEGTIGFELRDIGEEDRSNLLADISRAKDWVYVSCWHGSESESFAMWKIYGMHNEAISITIDIDSLKESLSAVDEMYAQIKHVGYKYREEYPKPLFDNDSELRSIVDSDKVLSGVFDALFLKHDGFSYEKEIRLVICDLLFEELDGNNIESGIYLPFDGKWIEQITISPLAEDWFYDVIDSLAVRYELDAQVYGSYLS